VGEHVVDIRHVIEIDGPGVLAELFTAWWGVDGRPHRWRWGGGVCGTGLVTGGGACGFLVVGGHGDLGGDCVIWSIAMLWHCERLGLLEGAIVRKWQF
jgi:hypothetical protein